MWRSTVDLLLSIPESINAKLAAVHEDQNAKRRAGILISSPKGSIDTGYSKTCTACQLFFRGAAVQTAWE